jgi:hypothetical protein
MSFGINMNLLFDEAELIVTNACIPPLPVCAAFESPSQQ